MLMTRIKVTSMAHNSLSLITRTNIPDFKVSKGAWQGSFWQQSEFYTVPLNMRNHCRKGLYTGNQF